MRSVRAVVGVVGELLITVGVVVLLFVVWQLGFVPTVVGRQQQATVSALEQDFGGGVPHPSRPTGPASDPLTPTDLLQAAKDNRAWGILRIPRLGGPSWARPIYEGVQPGVLAEGLGHYPTTALPGEVGNIAVAGHRAGHGNPLIDIDRIEPGDVMVIETRVAFYVYRVTRHQIVSPTDVSVLDPVPQRHGVEPTEAAFTLTSCNPRYGSAQRYIVFSTLEQTIPHDRGLGALAGLLVDPATAA